MEDLEILDSLFFVGQSDIPPHVDCFLGYVRAFTQMLMSVYSAGEFQVALPEQRE